MRHENGCPCTGWGGSYAICECDAIRLRNNTHALEQQTEALRRAEIARLEETNERDVLRAQVKRLQAEVRAWRDWLKECQTIPLVNCTCKDVPRGPNLIRARGVVDRNKDLE